jgi:uncharacterized membrane protein
MDELLMVVLRLVHIFGAVFWAGGSFFMVSFIQPAVLATGAEGQKFMQHLGLKTRLSTSMAGAGFFTVASGLIIYGMIFRSNPFASLYGVSLTLGAIAGIAAWIAGYYFQGRSVARMKVLSEQMGSAGGPPSPDQIAEMQELAKKLTIGGRISATLLTIALIGMAAADAF